MVQSGPARRKLKAVQSRYRRAEHDRRAAAIEAHAEGVPVTHVAEALGVNRVTVHRWLNDSRAAR